MSSALEANPAATGVNTDAVRIDHLSFRYQREGRTAGPVLRDVSLRVPVGENLGIIGPNGAGKTTLLRIILGLLDGYDGRVSVLGLSPVEACRRGNLIGYVPQRAQSEWRFPLSVRQVVRLGLVGKTGMFRRHSREDLEHVESLMEQLGIAKLAERPVGDLSGGQQQRLFIARALAPRPQLLLLDEPMSGIDVSGQRQIGELIRQLHQTLKLTVIVVSHDIEALAAGCTRIACLRQSLHYHDAPQGLTPQVLRAVFQHGYDAVFAGHEG